jgi:hypothetical protein
LQNEHYKTDSSRYSIATDIEKSSFPKFYQGFAVGDHGVDH